MTALIRGRSSVWLERLPVTQEVASSSLVGPAIDVDPAFKRGYFLSEVHHKITREAEVRTTPQQAVGYSALCGITITNGTMNRWTM